MVNNYFTGITTIKLTSASMNVSNFAPSTTTAALSSKLAVASSSVASTAMAVFSACAPVAAASSSARNKSALGIASKCCSSWNSDPVSIMYLISERIMKSALNVCHMCTLLSLSDRDSNSDALRRNTVINEPKFPVFKLLLMNDWQSVSKRESKFNWSWL